jgi:hypothetical protein
MCDLARQDRTMPSSDWLIRTIGENGIGNALLRDVVKTRR